MIEAEKWKERMLLKKKNKSEDNAMVEEGKEKIVMKAKVKVEKELEKGLQEKNGLKVGMELDVETNGEE